MIEVFRFIEKRLFWQGRVSRQDIRARFDLSESTAARFLRAYRELAPESMIYRPGGTRAYEASESFHPMMYKPDHMDSGLPTNWVAKELFEDDRNRQAQALLWIGKSLRLGRSLKFSYTDWQGQKTRREILPVSWVTIDGGEPSILHAYCYLRSGYRSFELGRMTGFEVGSRVTDAGLLHSPEAAEVKIRIGTRVIEVPKACVYPVVAKAYSAPSLRDEAMKTDIHAAVDRAQSSKISRSNKKSS